jgi:hypothetical protein
MPCSRCSVLAALTFTCMWSPGYGQTGEVEPDGFKIIDYHDIQGLDADDSFGYSVAALGDFDGDGSADVAVGAPGDDDGGADRGAVYFLFSTGNISTSSAFLGGTAKLSSSTSSFSGNLANGNGFGTSIGAIGDLNGDGLSELAVGGNTGVAGANAIWILFLNRAAMSNRSVVVSSVQKIQYTDPCFSNSCGGPIGVADGFGTALHSIGDLDRDGVPDIVLGTSGDPNGCSLDPACPGSLMSPGSIWVVLLNSDGSVQQCQRIGPGCGGLTTPILGCPSFGFSVSGVADFDDDGVQDFLVGGPFSDDPGPAVCSGNGKNGAVWILQGSAVGTGPIQLGPIQQKISANSGGGPQIPLAMQDRFGASVDSLGDLDGNAVPDIIVGAEQRKSAFLLFMNSDGTYSSYVEWSNADFNNQLPPPFSFGSFGTAMAWIGNLTSNGAQIGVIGGIRNAPGPVSCPIPPCNYGAVIVFSVQHDIGFPWSALEGPVETASCPNTNLSTLSASPPVIGSTWRAVVANPQHSFATIEFRTGALCPPSTTAYGQLWITGTKLFAKTQSMSGGQTVFVEQIPNDASLYAFGYYVQAVTLGNGITPQLSNARVQVVGFTNP